VAGLERVAGTIGWNAGNLEIRNPNIEIRNKSEIQMGKIQNAQAQVELNTGLGGSVWRRES
jgi:hypothetical protein